jgi:spoIIIJ-associated protein
MSENRASLEIIAPSVEEAVARGLADLGLPEEAVEVEVLDPGSKGLFGLGFRQARVRLTIKKSSQAAPGDLAEKLATPVKPEMVSAPFEVEETDLDEESSTRPFDIPVPVKTRTSEKAQQDEQILSIAKETVQDLLKKMKVSARVTAKLGEPDEPQERAPLLVDIYGDDLSILIGPKAETLNALQYISGLIISKEVGHSVPLVVDVEGYRARRTNQIRQLARRMAEQAIRTGRRQALEPMPASERRLVHIELRENPDVTTESVGEEPRRKVTIIPK